MTTLMLKTSLSSPSLRYGVGAAAVRQLGAALVNSTTLQQCAFHSSPCRLSNHPSRRPPTQEYVTLQQQQSMIAYHLHHNNPNLLGSLSVRHPSTPFVLGWGDVECEMEDPRMEIVAAAMQQEATLFAEDNGEDTDCDESDREAVSMKGRNSRPPKKANHGKRPCNRTARRLKRKRWGNPRRQ